jgi:hypothetical protein
MLFLEKSKTGVCPMMTRINLKEAKELLPRWLERPLVNGPIVVEDNGQPHFVVLGSQEYARYIAWRRREVIHSFILGEMDRRQAESWWDEGFDALDKLRQRARDLTTLEIEALIDEAVNAARQDWEES